MLRRRVLFRLATSTAFERAAMATARERSWRSARRYVAGERLEDAIETANRLADRGLNASIDLFGERTARADAPAVAERYCELCRRLPPNAWASLDLSHIAFDARLLDEIADAVPPGRRLQVGAEEAAHTDRVLDLVVARGAPLEATVQANLKRSPQDAERLTRAGIPIRLVKGAYVEGAAIAHPWGAATDAAYRDLARRLQDTDVALATHDASLQAVLPDARVEMLLGVRPELAATRRDVRIYVPYGSDWFRYFMRRRAEAQGA